MHARINPRLWCIAHPIFTSCWYMFGHIIIDVLQVVHLLSPPLPPSTHSTLRKDITKSKFLLLLLICVLVPFTFVCTIRCLVTTHPHYNFTIYGNVTFQTPLLLSVWFLLSLLNTTSCVYTCSLLSIQKSTQCTVHQNPGKLKYC